MKPIPRRFYERSPATVARELLGNLLVHRSSEGVTKGMIVETEAYFGRGDPASRASKKKTPLNELMWERGGLAFIYMIHGKWMLNITADKPGVPGAVLIRAVEPVCGMDLMKKRRGVKDELLLTSGPGRLTEAFGIAKLLHGADVTSSRSPLMVILGHPRKFLVKSSHRIGVKEDLREDLRFFIAGNSYVSK